MNCKSFVDYSFVTGKTKFVLANQMRSHVDYCGPGALYFQEKPIHEVFQNELDDILNKKDEWK